MEARVANDFEVGVDVAAPPDVVWVLAGDPGRIGEWFAPVTACEMDGEVRTVTMGSGAVLVERVERDDPARAYCYSVLSGIPGLTSHRATLRAVEAPAGSRVLWRQTATSEVEGYDIESRLAGVMTAGLERLRDVVEGRETA
jgi:Polyketide cyclase / dehydrase and lipid transport